MKLKGIIRDQGAFEKHLFLIAKHTSAWLSVRGATVTSCASRNGILLFLYACYNFNPPNIQNKCDGCMQNFSVNHALSFPNGALAIARHNKIRDEIIHLEK